MSFIDYGGSCESCDSVDSGKSIDSGDSGESGDSVDSGKSIDSSNSGESGNYGESIDSGGSGEFGHSQMGNSEVIMCGLMDRISTCRLNPSGERLNCEREKWWEGENIWLGGKQGEGVKNLDPNFLPQAKYPATTAST